MSAAQSTSQRHPLISKPLYVFDLPKEVVNHLEVCDALSPFATRSGDQNGLRSTDVANAASTLGAEKNQASCPICPGAGNFSTVAEQRGHYRSDWHRFNLQLERGGKVNDAKTREEFEKACEGEQIQACKG